VIKKKLIWRIIMSVKYTEKQKEAIYTNGCNILVAAAAGSGKTAVLTERIVQKVINKDNPQNIDSLLIGTFTEAATSEMRQRIASKLDKAFEIAEKNNDFLAEHISKQITLLNKSYISTIDSFCLNIVRKNFNLLDIDPNFRIIDNAEDDIIKEEVLNLFFEELYEKNDSDFIDFIKFFSDNYAKNTDTKVKKIIFDIYKLMQSMPNPLNWLNKSVESFNLSDDKTIFETKWINFIKKELSIKLEEVNNKNDYILNLFYSYPDTSEKFINCFEEFKEHLKYCKNIIENDLKNYTLITETNFKFVQLRKSKANPLNDELYEKLTSNKLKDKLTKSYKDFKTTFDYFSKESLDLIRNTYPALKTMRDIIEEFSQRCFKIKKEKFTFSFNDISHLALKVLMDENGNPTNIAKELRNKFNEVITDEYQDVSELQESILSLVSRQNPNLPNRFMVGDIKQCIYGFRLANPQLFANKYDSYTTDISFAKDNGYRIDLFDNFRSRECILSAINFIFKQTMTKSFCKINYDNNAMLHYGANYPTADDNIKISDSVELELINPDKDDEELDDDIKDLIGLELEFTVIANKIENMVNIEKLHIYDNTKKNYRPVEYRDIVILCRSTKKIPTVLQTIFTKNKIPFSAKAKIGYFESLEVETILAFLSVLDNPYQEIQLYTVLHSPVYSFTFDELVKVKTTFPNKSFYDAMLFYITAENKDREIKIVDKINLFLRDFEKWKEFSLNSTINELLQTIYDDTDYYNYIGTFPNGNLRRMNLKLLQEKAIQFEKTNSKGLFKFMKYIEKVKSTEISEEANIFYENENVVTVTNIHQSKGLEYPVVFICNINKNFFFDTKKYPVDQTLGIGARYKDTENNVVYNTIPYKAIRAKEQNDIRSEEMRILYVAMTRAKEKLILSGSIQNFNETISNYIKYTNTPNEPLPEILLERSKSFAEIIIASLARHKSGTLLREYLPEPKNTENINKVIFNDFSNWKINITTRADLSISQKKSNAEKQELYKQLQTLDITRDYSGLKEEIKKRLNWTYPNCEIQNIPITTSISEIKRKAYDEEEYIPKNLPSPHFIKEYIGLTSAQKGTAMHTIMEHIDLKNNYNKTSLNNYIHELVNKNILSKQEEDSINIQKILTFLNSEIAARIKKSDKIHKETQFVMGLKPSDILGSEYLYSDKDPNNNILVHGIIDLYFEENNKLILLDYKTDYVENNNTSYIISKYKIQIELYKKALELSTGKEVKEAGLYLFGANAYEQINFQTES